MKNFVMAGAAAAMVLTALPAMAATVSPNLTNNITSGDNDGSYKATFSKTSGGMKGDTFTAMFDFVVDMAGKVSAQASVTNSFTSFLDLTTFKIFGSGITTQNGSFSTPSGSQQGSIASFIAPAGTYTLEVDGTLKSNLSKAAQNPSFNGNVQLSAVPLPTSVALFGVALAGLGVAGAVRRKVSAKASA